MSVTMPELAAWDSFYVIVGSRSRNHSGRVLADEFRVMARDSALAMLRLV
jgi:hypothetical protein